MIKKITTNRFEKELTSIVKRGRKVDKLLQILDLLELNINKGLSYYTLLPPQYSLHKLSGKYKNRWECHIEPDWLLIFYLDKEVLKLERTGTHSDLFKD